MNNNLRVFKRNRAVFLHSIHKWIIFSPNYSPLVNNLHLPYIKIHLIKIKFPCPKIPSPNHGGFEEREMYKTTLTSFKRKQWR